MKEFSTDQSRALFLETKKYIADGVSSSFHKSPIEPYPICFERGKGSKLYDIDGNEYIDYVLGFGPVILGHSPEVLNQAIVKQMTKGSQFSSPNSDLLKLSKKLTEIIPCAEKVSFFSTGTEAVMHALRLTRAYTGKEKIVKFEGHYHGWSDEEKVTIDAGTIGELGPRNNIKKILHSDGQRASSGDDLIIAPWNDLVALEQIFKRKGNEIAAVIMEPFMCDTGPIYPAEGYLAGVRELTKKYDILLFFDEVITGFRLALGGAQEYFGVTPDLATFAKAIAGGYPLSAVVGKREILDCGHPSGTFNGNPISVAAALATIQELESGAKYEQFDELGNLLVSGILALGQKHKIPLYSKAVRAICLIQFGVDRPLKDFRDCFQANSAQYDTLFLGAQKLGVRLTYKRGRIYLSTEHTEQDIEKTLSIFDYILSRF